MSEIRVTIDNDEFWQIEGDDVSYIRDAIDLALRDRVSR